MKHFFLGFGLLLFNVIIAQVGINTTTPKASLDIQINDATNPTNEDGILIPRIDVFPATNPTVNQNGMLVYLTTTVGLNEPGFYYWDNPTTTWIGLQKAGEKSRIIDTDLDTQIQVEKSADDDTIRFDIAGTERMKLSNGNTNIETIGGLTNPSGTLELDGYAVNVKNSNGGVQTVSIEGALPGNVYPYAKLDLRNKDSNNSNTVYTGASIRSHNDGSTDDGDLRFYTTNNTSLTEKLRITSSGNIGVGTTNPLNKLHVNGNIRMVDGNQQAGYIMTSDANGTATWTAPTNQMSLIDTDLDTQIQVEESADDDTIRFDISGTEYFTMKNGRINVLNTGQSVFIGENAGLNDDLTDNFNTAIGKSALLINTTGAGNTAIGRNALYNNNGNGATAVGMHALFNNTTGVNNTSIGFASSNSNTTGLQNTVLGAYAFNNNITGNNNTVIGMNAGRNATGSDNVFLGAGAGNNATGSNNVFLGLATGRDATGSGNVFLGNNAGLSETGNNKLYIDNSNTTTPLIYGDFSTNLLQVNGTLNVNGVYQFPTIDGTSGQALITDGSGNVAWTDVNGEKAKLIDTDLDTQIQVEESADDDTIRFDISGTEYFTMKNGRINVLNTGQSTYLGENAGLNDDFTNNLNTGIGRYALFTNITGNSNTAVGRNALYNHTGDAATAIGTNALMNNTTGYNNTAVGSYSSINTTTGYQNTVLGAYALNTNITGSNNTIIGMNAGRNSTGSNNVFLGASSGLNATGTGNVFLGTSAGLNETGNNKLYIDNSNTTSPLIYGDFATNLVRVNGTLDVNNTYQFPTTDGTSGQALITNGSGTVAWTDVNGEKTQLIDADLDTKIEVEAIADEDIIRFTNAGINGLNIVSNRIETTVAIGHTVKIGFEAGFNDDSSDRRNNFIGFRAGKSTTTGANNNALGAGALQLNTTGSENIAFGYVALNQNLTGSNNLAIGSQSLYKNTIGQYNIALGNTALRENTEGNHNIALGLQALYNNLTSDSNIALGSYSLLKLNSGISNVSIGRGTLRELVTGDSNTAIGVNAGQNNTAGNNNSLLGYQAAIFNTNGSNNTILGYQAGRNATTGSSNVFIGYQAGYSESSDNKLYIENTNSTSPLVYGEFDTNYLQVNGNFDVGANGDGTIARANAWNTFSDRRWKTNFKKIENSLGKLDKINGYYYNWKNRDDKSLQVGVIAQEIEEVLPEVVSTDEKGYKSVDYSKLSALLIEATKEQQAIIENQETQIEELNKKYTDLQQEIENIKKMLKKE